MDWSKHGIEGWLKQYGNWVQSGHDKGVRGHTSPCGEFMMRNVPQKRSQSSFGACNIEDWEARAVGRLIIDLGGIEARAIIWIYEFGESERKTAEILDISRIELKQHLRFAFGWMSGVTGIKDDKRGHKST